MSCNPTLPHVLSDVYDCRVWKEFESKGYFRSKFNLALTLNVDWFRPFKRSFYSIGVLYFVVNNLPRELRYKEENVILAGVIPGPREPSLDINSFLQPIVEELIPLWKGERFTVPTYGVVICRAMVICVAADIPASRKIGGFLGHQAELGCTKCLTSFPRTHFSEKPNYGGYDRKSWQLRTNEDHRKSAEKVRLASTETAKTSLEHQTGARYSQLFRLEYYDCIRFLIIDPMHNLLLGTAKHVMDVWREKGIITDENFHTIQVRIHDLQLPSDLGRSPA